MKQDNLLTSGIIGLALYLIVTGLSYAFFSTIGARLLLPGGLTSPVPTDQEHFVVDPSLPKTEECVLNGKMYTRPERDIWEKRRPLAVMIENHAESRPQSGLSYADVVYEAVAEGGITRFMGVFYCGVAAKGINLAPVRSARSHYLPWVLEYDALYNHVGGAGRCNDPTVDERAKALCQIGQFNIKDMDQFGISFPTCFRNYDRLDHPVATEHTMVCVVDKLYTLAATRGWTDVDAKGISWDNKFESWKFKDDVKQSERPASSSAQFAAWSGYEKEYGVRWDYDPDLNSYKRTNGGVPHVDLETNQQLTAKAIIIIFAKETGPVDTHAHILYTTIGTGNGYILQDGKVTDITWRKPDKSSRTKYFDTNGREISINRGQLWIELLPIGTKVTF